MKLISILMSVAIIIFFFIACGNKSNPSISESGNKSVSQSKFAQLYPDFHPEQFGNKFKEGILKDSLLQIVYSKNEFKSIFFKDTLNSEQISQIIKFFEDSKDHGLSQNTFMKNEIDSIFQLIEAGTYKDSMEVLYDKIIELEKLTTNSIIKYTTGMHVGFLDPYKLFKKEFVIQVKRADSLFYENLFTEIINNPVQAIIASHSTDDVYKNIQKEYKYLLNADDLKFSKIENKGDKFNYKLGDKSHNITKIANRLKLTGEYTVDSVQCDSLGTVMDEELLASVNKFRTKISYPTDTVVGSLTIDALNRPLDYYKQTLQANLERYRWRRIKKKGAKNIEVNIPSFELVATQSDSTPVVIKVCTGTVGNRTPMLESDIAYINLNPTWSVPTSIARNELSGRIIRDQGYLKRNNMKLYKGGKPVDPSTVDWSQVSSSKFGYSIVQGSGAGNSLGRIKFMFNNPFSVYLHDTPTRGPFGRKNRAVSHGCVRVEKPMQLAYFCFSPASDEYKDQILYSIGYNPETATGKKLLKEGKLKKLPNILNIDEKQHISLFIDYRTVYMYPNDESIYYADDVYNYDNLILKELNKIL